MTFSEKMLETIEKYNMLEDGGSVLVALSGGADSVGLFLGILELKDKLGLNVSAAHINHQLRGKDADRDMDFVEQLCKKYDIPLYILKKDVAEYSRINKCSLEEGGRRVRYEFFNSLAKNGCKIATAHTKNDNSENFFISALRGTAICGIPPVRGNIIRPLINITKTEIYEYLEEKNQSFCVDESNFTEDYFRNKIRLKLIPYIEKEFNADIAEILGNNLDVIYFENEFLYNAAEDFIDKYCELKSDEAKVDILEFNKCHTALKRRILRKIYYIISKNEGYISFTHIDSIINMSKKGDTGKQLPLCKGLKAEISYDKLIIRKAFEKCEFYYILKKNESLFIEETDMKIMLSNKESKHYFTSNDEEFTVRSRNDGDRIYINKVGHKKLSDFFTDKKIPRAKRDEIPVITDSLGICAVGDMYFRKENAENKVYIHTEIN